MPCFVVFVLNEQPSLKLTSKHIMNSDDNQCERFSEKSKLLYTPCDVQEHEGHRDSPDEEVIFSGIITRAICLFQVECLSESRAAIRLIC